MVSILDRLVADELAKLQENLDNQKASPHAP